MRNSTGQHYVSSALSERKQQLLKEKLSKAAQPVVFDIVRESQCSECGAAIARGGFLLMEGVRRASVPTLRAPRRSREFFPSGDTALTRRPSKYSGRSAVVVRFSWSHGAATKGKASW